MAFSALRFDVSALRSASVVAFSVITLCFVACGGQAQDSGDGDTAGDGDGDGTGGVFGDGDGTGGGVVGDGDGDGVGDGDVDRSCASTSECLLVSATCCGACGAPAVTDMTAIRIGQEEAHRDRVCVEEFPICPGCAAQSNPNLFAECVRGQCEAVDLTMSDDSACTTSDECIVIPAACCECGAGANYWEVVAINASQASEFRASQCARDGMGGPVACPECEYLPPSDLVAECVDRRCTLTGPGVPLP